MTQVYKIIALVPTTHEKEGTLCQTDTADLGKQEANGHQRRIRYKSACFTFSRHLPNIIQ